MTRRRPRKETRIARGRASVLISMQNVELALGNGGKEGDARVVPLCSPFARLGTIHRPLRSAAETARLGRFTRRSRRDSELFVSSLCASLCAGRIVDARASGIIVRRARVYRASRCACPRACHRLARSVIIRVPLFSHHVTPLSPFLSTFLLSFQKLRRYFSRLRAGDFISLPRKCLVPDLCNLFLASCLLCKFCSET